MQDGLTIIFGTQLSHKTKLVIANSPCGMPPKAALLRRIPPGEDFGLRIEKSCKTTDRQKEAEFIDLMLAKKSRPLCAF
jgi:hypothetical protein